MSKWESRLVKIIFSLFTLVMLAPAVGSYVIMKRNNQLLIDAIRNNLQGMARVAAARLILPGEVHQMQSPGDMEKPLYAEVKRRLWVFLQRTEVSRVYLARRNDEGDMQYIVDGDDDPETRFDLMSPPVNMSPHVQQVFEGADVTLELEEYIQDNEGFIVSFSPVWSNLDEVIAIMAVEMKDDHLLTLQRQSNLPATLMLAAILIVMPAGWFFFSIYRKRAAKNEFLSRMSHEMRTPLNAIIGLSELVIGDKNISLESRENAEKVNVAGTTLLGIINDILDITKVEYGKFELLPVEYDLPSLINDIVTLNIMRINDKPIKFVLQVDDSLPSRLLGDELRVKQIFNNLLSNAFKYTREGQVEWRLTAEIDGKGVWLVSRIADTGIGIHAEDLKKIFLDYYQVDRRMNRKIEGTGLGLSITKMLIGMMHGQIEVQSEYGKGTTFNVRILQDHVDDTPIGEEVVNSLQNFHYIDDDRVKKASAIGIFLPYARILVVDDVPVNLDVARGLMRPYGMTIDCAASGQEAIDLIWAKKTEYHAIFMDHMMPGMDGIEATRRIRAIGTDYAKNIPIIALTANAVVGSAEIFLSNGFNDFLPKPIDVMRLDTVIRKWVRDKIRTKMCGDTNIQVRKPSFTVSRVFEKVRMEGVDFAKGVSRFGGAEDSYTQILRAYAASVPSLLEKVRSPSRESLNDYAVVIHGIKGASYGICADDVGKLAEELEHAAKKGDWNFIEANNLRFIKLAGMLSTNLDVLLNGMSPRKEKERKNEPDAGTLEWLRKACENYDMDGVNAAMLELESFEYDYGDELVVWLRKRVDGMDFSGIQHKLSSLDTTVVLPRKQAPDRAVSPRLPAAPRPRSRDPE